MSERNASDGCERKYVPFTLRKMTLLTPAPMVFFASHRKCPCASLVIRLKCNDPLLYNSTFGSYKNSLYSPGVAPNAFPVGKHNTTKWSERRRNRQVERKNASPFRLSWNEQFATISSFCECVCVCVRQMSAQNICTFLRIKVNEKR